MIAKFIVTLAFADAQTLKQADFRESAQEVGGQNAEAVIDAPEEGDRRQLALKRQGAIRRKTTTTTLPPKKKPLSRQNAVKGRKLGEEDEDSEAEADSEAACVDKQTTDDRCLSSHYISGVFSKQFKVGASCSYWKGKRWCLNDASDYQDSKRAMKDCCALTCNYCGADKREAGPKTPTFIDKISKASETIHAVADNVNAVRETVKGVQEAVEGVGHAVGLPVDRIKNKSKEILDAGKNKAIELATKGGNKVKEAVNSRVRKVPKGSGGSKRGGSKKKRGGRR